MLRLLVPLLLSVGPPEALPPEARLAAATLRAGEKARYEKGHGAVVDAPLYRAALTFDPATRKASGTVLVSFPVGPEPRDELLFRVTPNANHPEAVSIKAVTARDTRAEWDWADASLVRVHLKPPAAAREVVQVALTLEAELPKARSRGSQSLDDLSGRGGDYGAFASAPEVSSLSGLIPMVPPEKPDGSPFDASSGIGDLGSFAPSNFFVSLTVPNGYRAVMAGHAIGEVPDGKGSTQFVFAQSLAREFPLLVTRGYTVSTQQVGDVTIESHYLPEDVESGKAVLTAAALAVRDLDAKVGPYPWTHLRVVEARLASGAGGMEFPGLITASQTLYSGAADPGAALGLPPGKNGQLVAALLGSGLGPLMASTLEFTIHHEIAHQWFAMVVGNDPIDSPITDEALAQHVALLLTEWRHGKKLADALRQGQLKGSYQLYRAMGGRDGVADRPAGEFKSNGEYAALVYGKAPLLYDEVRKAIGDEAWLKALRAYTAQNRWGWAAPDGPIAAAAEIAPGKAKALRALRQHWLDEAHGDEDLGAMTFDLGAMMGGASGSVGNGNLPGVDPADLKALLKQYEELMKSLSGP